MKEGKDQPLNEYWVCSLHARLLGSLRGWTGVTVSAFGGELLGGNHGHWDGVTHGKFTWGFQCDCRVFSLLPQLPNLCGFGLEAGVPLPPAGLC